MRTGPTPAFMLARVSAADGVRVAAFVRKRSLSTCRPPLAAGSFGHRAAARSICPQRAIDSGGRREHAAGQTRGTARAMQSRGSAFRGSSGRGSRWPRIRGSRVLGPGMLVPHIKGGPRRRDDRPLSKAFRGPARIPARARGRGQASSPTVVTLAVARRDSAGACFARPLLLARGEGVFPCSRLARVVPRAGASQVA